MKLSIGVRDVSVTPLVDAEYPIVLKKLIKGAKVRCLCSLFIVDPLPRKDSENRVYSLLMELRNAKWRGVDTRLLIGGSRTNVAIAELSQFSRDLGNSLGVPSCWLTGKKQRGSHVKMVIIDDNVLMGSHNWSPGAFLNQTQDSLIVQSAAFAEVQSVFFEKQWKRGEYENLA